MIIFMRFRKAFNFNRIILLIAFIQALFNVWWQLNPNLLTWVGAVFTGIFTVLLSDRLLLLVDPLAEKIVRLLILAFIGGWFIWGTTAYTPYIFLVLPVTVSLPIFTEYTFAFILEVWEQATLFLLSGIRAHLNPIVSSFSRKHGAYLMHPLTQSLLFYE